MAGIQFDAATELESTLSTDPLAFNHTPVGTPKGVVVTIGHGVLSADNVNGVTYGGVAMTRRQTNSDTLTEPGRTYIYSLHSSIPTGLQSVSVDWITGNTNAKHLCCMTFTTDEADDTEFINAQGLNEDQANPSVTLSGASGGRTSIGVAVDYTGTASPGTAGTGTTLVHSYDMTAFGIAVVRQTTPTEGAFAISVTHVSDDCAFSAVNLAGLTVPRPGSLVVARTRP